MNMTKKVSIDLITKNPKNNEYKLILVEEGPWEESTLEDRLRKIQDRIYNAVDAAVDGALFQNYPDSKGQKVCVQVDCYDPPPDMIEQLVKDLGQYVDESYEYQNAIKRDQNISSLRIAYNENNMSSTQQSAPADA